MGIFRNRSVHRGYSNGYVQRPVASRPAPPQTTPPPAQAQNAVPPQSPDKVSAQPSEAPSQSGGSSLFGGLTQNFGGSMVKQLQQAVQGSTVGELMKAQQGVQLSPEERAQVQQAAGVMQRLAGADGLWNRADLPNNVNQLEKSGDLNRAVNQEIGRRWGQELNQRGMLGRALVNGHMHRNYGKYEAQGMQQARGMARGQLGEGQDKAGVNKTAGHDDKKTTPEGFKKANEPISRAEMEKFQKTMDMLQEKSRAQGMPEVKFPNGVPAQFLKDLADGKSPQKALQEAGAVLQLKNGKTFDLSKLPQAAQEQKGTEKPSEKTPETTPEKASEKALGKPSEGTSAKPSEKTSEAASLKTSEVSPDKSLDKLEAQVAQVGQAFEHTSQESTQAKQADGEALAASHSNGSVDEGSDAEGSSAPSEEAGAVENDPGVDGQDSLQADAGAEASEPPPEPPPAGE